jgi:CRP-like cAMP-binding protein
MSVPAIIFEYVAKEEIYEDNEYIIREGSLGEWVYVVLEGRVKVRKISSKGLVTLDTLKEGDIFGEMVLWQIGKGTRSASVIADGTVTVGVLDTQRLHREYEQLSPRLKSLMKSLIIRLRETTKKAVIMAVDSR